MEIVFGIVAIVVLYIIVNGLRNRDPHNRKCAAEICEYVTSGNEINPEQIHQIFMDNARYQKHANHISSMIPALLISAGYPRDAAMGVVPLIKSVALTLPK